MRAEDVARENQFREGFHLVDYAEVGLPIFRLTIEAITTSIRSIPTIHEFAMRCIHLGESQEHQIGKMLGLSEDIVTGAVDSLVLDGLVTRTAIIDGHSNFGLTPLGEERLAEESQEIIQEEMIVVDYDAMRRKPIRLAGENVLRAAELRDFGAIEIRPYPIEPPPIDELAIPEVSRVIRRRDGQDFHRNILALKQVVRRSNVFREAVCLVYASDKGNEIQVSFAIDGRILESHERAFAQNGGPKKMGFVKAVGNRSSQAWLRRLIGGEVIQALPSPQTWQDLRLEEAEARRQKRVAEDALESAQTNSSRTRVMAALDEAKERYALSRHSLDVLPARQLSCFEQDEILREAMNEAKASLVVTTAGLQPTMLTQHDLRQIDNLMAINTSVHIGSFLSPQTEPRGGSYFDPLSELTKRQKTGLLKLYKTRQSAFFYLIKDDDLAVISNRPFFGEVSRRSSFQRVVGIVIRDRRRVAEVKKLAAKVCGLSANG
ncbi:hypothetical protein [Qipengyuania zhejiangensis]|uniref:hypothetical protein n=1 Tax=Qipengyuania zhejiangensis TaxID=3077782 RepID=UPI002D773FBE|nr:hypothetical protein [Qipengyuania sp. Z2]